MLRKILFSAIISIAWLTASIQTQESAEPEPAQEGYITEGYSALAMIPESMAQNNLYRLQRENPKATLRDALLYFARRKAATDARRNLSEYYNGVHFKFVAGKFSYEIKACEGFVGGRGVYSYRLLDSGVVIATKKLNITENLQQKRLELQPQDVTGHSSNNPANILQALREARMNAIEKAAKKAVKLKYPSAFQEKENASENQELKAEDDKEKTQMRTYQGVVYIVTTVSDKLGPPYHITLRVQTEVE